MKAVDVAIVGGGFSGAAFAIHLARRATHPLDIAIVEPNAELGRGLAYGTGDPDHRLNAPAALHFVHPETPGHAQDWYLEDGGLARDPEAETAEGYIYMRRAEFGRYMGTQLAEHIAHNPSGSAIRHVRDRALDLERAPEGFVLRLEDGERLAAGLVVVTTTNEPPATPAPLDGEAARHPAFVGDPWDPARLAEIPVDAGVLILGVSQTASDVLASLLRQGHGGPITAVSRRGLRPRKRPAGAPGLPEPLPERLDRPVSLFVEKHGRLASVIRILRTLRSEVRAAERAGGFWMGPFDDLRDSVWQVWPGLPLAEKRRFMRHLRTWYDVHRFRLPPTVEARIDAAVDAGQVSFLAASVASAAVEGDRIAVTLRQRGTTRSHRQAFDAVINCTGPQNRPERSANPFLRALVAGGQARPHPTGIGLDVDDDNRAIAADGKPDPRLMVVGPLTYGAFADQQGVPFIAARLHAIMPAVVEALSRA